MRQRSALFDRMMRRSHTLATSVDVLYNRVPVLRGVNVLGGSVKYDRTAAVMGSCSVTFAEPTRLPTGPTSPLTPYGYELAVRRGVTFGDGTTELIGLGVFPIQTSEVDDTLAGTVSGQDRAKLVQDAKLEDDYAIAAGTNYGTAIQALLEHVVPGLVYQFSATTFTTPALVFEVGSDAWAKAQDMAKAIGMWLYFDGDGACRLRPEPTLTGAVPVWTFDEGPTGVLLSAAVKLDRGPAYNRVIVTGENSSTGAVFTGTATDTTSAIAYTSGFGRKPKFIRSELVASNEQAEAMATADLAGTRGISRSVPITAVPHPALEPGDPVLIRRAELGLNEVHLIDGMTIGLSAGDALSAETRSVIA
jgi:hypothetical protein